MHSFHTSLYMNGNCIRPCGTMVGCEQTRFDSCWRRFVIWV